MSRKLIVNDGRRERELLLIGKIVVGRDPLCDISDADALLSRRHAEFIASTDGVVVRDLGSRNGIFVNGARIAEGALRPGDTVQIGHLQLRFVEDSEPIAAAPEMADGEATAVIYTPPRPGAAPAVAGAAAVPPAPAAARPTPVPAPPPPAAAEEDDADQTSLVPPPGLNQMARPGTGSTPPVVPMPPPNPSASHPGLTADEDDQTRVVAGPELRAAIHIAMAHPASSPAQAAAQVFAPSASGSGVGAAQPSSSASSAAAALSGSGASPAAPSSGAAVPPPPPILVQPAPTAVPPTPSSAPTPVPASPPSAPPATPSATARGEMPSPAPASTPVSAPAQVSATAAPPISSAAAQQPWAMFVQTRIGFAAGAVVLSALVLPALNQTMAVTALLTIAVGGIAAFVVSAMIIEQANQAAKVLKQDLDQALEGRLDAVRDSMGTASSKDLADALNGLVARVRAAEAHRR